MRNGVALRLITFVVASALLAGAGAALWFMPPQTSAEWAAWVQAAGVCAALGLALRLQYMASRQASRQADRVATLFAANMHWVFRELSDACIKRAWADFAVHRRVLQEVLAQGREVSLQQLDGSGLAMVTSLRAMGVEGLEMVATHTPQGDWHHLHRYFEKRLPSIAGWLALYGHPPESSGPTDYQGLRTSFGQFESR
ncbi:hypothetical protein [Pseudacidovorax intermedius]|uniref:hypothetical protein n=1 Tax=Pseudacidovorax intermedius TaxID=433924 RepID=UPI00128F425B|nr:hypothetical protein [Pseudacidovorax intermedius]